MTSRLFVPVLLAICSCSAGSEGTRAGSTSDSAEVVTELSPPVGSVLSPRGSEKATDALSRGNGPTRPGLPAAESGRATASSRSPVTELAGSANPPGGTSNRSDLRCGVRSSPVLTDLGIGNLQIARTLAVVKQTCRVIRDEPELNEGALERVLTVMISDDPVRVTAVNGLVWRISITRPSIATRDGLRVGTPLSRLVSKGAVHLAEGQDGLYVTLADHCGLSFRFSIQSRAARGKPWTVAHLVQLHGSATVDRILVTRCTR